MHITDRITGRKDRRQRVNLIYKTAIDLMTYETDNGIDIRDRRLAASRWAFDREGRGLPATYREEMEGDWLA